jgi:hypothetical protein
MQIGVIGFRASGFEFPSLPGRRLIWSIELLKWPKKGPEEAHGEIWLPPMRACGYVEFTLVC